MGDKNFMSYGDAETLMTEMVSWADGKFTNPGVATTQTAGLVKPDGTTITVDSNGTISASADLSNYIEKSATEGLVKNDGTIDTSNHINLQPDGYVNGNKFSTKTWYGLTSFNGKYIWTDGGNIYYSDGSTQYVLIKSTSAWSTKTWNGYTSITGDKIWTDGDNIYYSYSSTQYVLDKSTSTWNNKTWNGYTSIAGNYIWTDGDNIYYSSNGTQKVLDKSTSTWSNKTWNGLTNFIGAYIWTDGDNIYYSNSSTQYVLDKSTSTWSTKTWNISINGAYIWTDGDNIYYSSGSNQYVLNKSTSTWTKKTWSGYSNITGERIWTDGDNIYYSSGGYNYVLNKVPVFADGYVKSDGSIVDLPVATTASAGTVKPDGTTITVDANGVISLTYLERTVTLSTSAETTVTFTDSRFTANSCVDVATPWGIVPTNVVTAAGTCTITLPKVDSAQTISVRLYLR